jgi:hypothetical protein
MTRLIRNDTARLECEYGRYNEAGVLVPESISGLTIASMMRLGSASMTWTVVDRQATDGTGKFWLTADASAMGLMPGAWSHDIQATAGATVRSTLAEQVTIAEDVTYAG